MMLLVAVLIFLLVSNINAFVSKTFKGNKLALNALKEVVTVSEIRDGDRKIIETENGSVIITNVKGSFYAVNAKCPHLVCFIKKTSS